ncbi:putative ABC transporter ATP-binding protein YlmA [Corynebacterium occultum]|uniref:Putative ABC transporter ATP-binding protein YlmA n=1 Tax=Corynebacterium occultum TaxID=2675219 RepID=A0A6B8VVM3_9CORY|nr:ATP-binding cassette domain-containing protein [Corynebacterium occultum]QGU08193.1 putative ABC transporter ATP-binding protein YlmA [Corynebacterium occultum]
MSTVINLDNVTFRRNGKDIIHGASLCIGRGEHWAMLGPNGAGKSTILGFCAAESFPTSGTVEVLGNRLGRVDMAALRRNIGHVNPRHRLHSPLTVTQVVLTGITGTIDLPMYWEPAPQQLERAAAEVELLGLGSISDEIWPTLSQGERGRALIARALIAEPELLLLDEPSTGLDVAAREQLLGTLDDLNHARPGLTSILVTHHLEELPESTTHAVLISDGLIPAAGPVHEVLNTENISRAFHHPIQVEHREGRWSARAVRERSYLH